MSRITSMWVEGVSDPRMIIIDEDNIMVQEKHHPLSYLSLAYGLYKYLTRCCLLKWTLPCF